MPIILNLVPTRPSFCPGDVLTATLEVGVFHPIQPLKYGGKNVSVNQNLPHTHNNAAAGAERCRPR